MTRPLRRTASLEYRLPLLITALLVAITSAGLLFAYAESRQTATDSATERLRLLSRDISRLIAPSVATRLQTLTQVGTTPAVGEFLASRSPSSRAGALAELETLRVPTQPNARIVLLDREGRPVLELPHETGQVRGPLPLDALPDPGFGPFFTHEGRAHYWALEPVEHDGVLVGALAELRQLGGAGTPNPVESLIGSDVLLRFTSVGGDGSRVTLDGDVYAPPPDPAFTGPAVYTAEGETEHYAHAEAIPGTPWIVVTEMPTSAVLARPRTFLRRGSLAALALCVVGAGAAWALSRTITRPLKRLWVASDAVARGEHPQRLDLDREDELGVLADAFSEMSTRVQTTHDRLQAQVDTAQALAAQLDRASRAKSEFLATMSHEIRTPINAIIGYTDLLLLGVPGPPSEGQVRQLERIGVSSRHLAHLVDQVLDLSRIEAGRLSVEDLAASARDSIATALTVVGPQAAANRVSLTAARDAATEHRYRGDPRRVEQVLVNLASNAVKFTEPGGSVTIRCYEPVDAPGIGPSGGRWTCLEVEDTGIGIPSDQLEQIFEPFVQVDSGYTRRHGGAGLGLAISRHLARSMGGDVTVRSQPGAGSTFTVWLPSAPAEGVSGESGRVERLEGPVLG